MKIVFLGCTKFSEELLDSLINNSFNISAIFTIPQEFTVRKGEKIKNSNYVDLKPISEMHDIPLYYVDENKKIGEYEEIIKEINPDIILVLGWYYIVPKKIREIPIYGACGIHASLLPKYAGWAPLVWAMINGEKETGVTFFQFDDSVDGGDIIAQEEFEIEYKDTIKEVYEKATNKSADILVKTLPILSNIQFIKQDKSKLEIWDKRTPEDGKINWQHISIDLYNFIRAQTLPYPCAFSIINSQTIKIINSQIVEIDSTNYKVGEIVLYDDKALVATSDYFLEVGLIDDGKEIQQFKDYAGANNLWGGVFESKKS
ncbi:methionyl-tRNA formyltransferase [Aliarcobacter cryaerophilus]|uniref:methionyl-tRNA formyltransferase n=1 Tax=Aliarcobacter cryaerophilus TaxID=28198 RepID=UPI0011DF73CF|nr:methionyl-tRNA formyltransferase [Aliarcobacter cryaerophilus]